MPIRSIMIRDKIATAEKDTIVCDNSDYIIHFDFDAEWAEYEIKTMVVEYEDFYQEVAFEGNAANLPIIHNARRISIGVYAGNLHTTTPAYFPCCLSVTSELGVHDDPPEDVYHQLLELIRGRGGLSPLASSLLLDILKAGVYTSDVSDKIDQLEKELSGDEYIITQIGSILQISKAPATQTESILHII